ncbi:MAG: biopolymer transporter ExbD [Kiritimatiellae bacterium]|nr:biopolymer transporter ExbD [Kiritimatiellia bacterium]
MQIPVEKLFESEAKFEMAPMIDMVFLLLVFFMCASHLSVVQSVPLEIPTATKAVVPDDRSARFTVNITKDGTVFYGNEQIALADLKTVVKNGMAIDPSMKLYLRADQETAHRFVKKVMNVMGEAGVDNFVFGVFVPD